MKTDGIEIFREGDFPKGKNILIFSPHPDDTSICAGGAALLLSKNNQVVSCVMTTGHRADISKASKKERILIRKNESQEEVKILRAQLEFLQLGLYDFKQLDSQDLEVVIHLLEKYHPELIFLPNLNDSHPTHALCRELILKAIERYLEIHTVTIQLWHYESPWSLFDRQDYNVMVPLPKEIFERKLKAIQAHPSQNARVRYDTIASSLASLRAAVVSEQTIAGYGKEPSLRESYAELFSVYEMGVTAKLVETFSGIRGIFRKGLTEQVALDYGYVYGNWLKHAMHLNPKVVVGMDTRASSPILKKAIVQGLIRAHCHLFDVGMATTPLVQFEVKNRGCQGGVMITASHNEPHWNGFKFFWQDGSALNPDQMREVITHYHAEIQEAERPYVDHYLKFLSNWIGEETIQKIREAKLKVVVDPNGGAILVVLQKLFDLLGIETIALNMRPGYFAHAIEPTAKALKDLAPLIPRYKADFGVAWDCDGDRIEIMLPNGELLSGHTILALLVDQVLRKASPGQTVVVNAATSRVVKEVAKRHGANVYETDVGETNVVSLMKEKNAIVGGEGASGGGIIAPSQCRDGVMTLLKILEKMVEEKKSLMELIQDTPKFYTRQANISLDATRMDFIRNELIRVLDNASVRKIGQGGGVKFEWEDGSFLFLRESKTERNLMRIVVDSLDPKKLEDLFNKAIKILQ